jgi:co-chaperonin GroES (HSP10)
MEFTMVLEPKNSWIEIDLSFDKKEKKEESIIALPEDYKHGDVVVVPTHVVQEIEIVDNKFYLVERNYIMASVGA